MRALAYTPAGGYAADLAYAFVAGCKFHGVDAEVRSAESFAGPEPCNFIWLFGVVGQAHIFDAYRGRARRITGDLGYWRERASELPMSKRPVRIAVYIGKDRPGLLSEITGAISSRNGNITKAEVTVTDDRRGINNFVVEVADLGQLQAIMTAIREVADVINVERVRGL